MATKSFFYLKDIQFLIEEALKAGGSELGIVITHPNNEATKPSLHISYIPISKEKKRNNIDAVSASITVNKGELTTNVIEGCPYPPRCN